MNAYEASLKRKWDAENVRLTAERMGMEKGLQKGLQQGLQKGRLEERIKAEKRLAQERAKAAKKMLANGLTVELISDFLGIPKEEIEALMRVE